jgi:hypothetical protein
MTAEQKRLERLHILATLAQYGPMTGLELVKVANDECADDRFDQLPDLSPRGVGQKLNALSLRRDVRAEYIEAKRLYEWSITDMGRAMLAASGVEV